MTGLALLLALRIATGQTPDGGAREVDQLSAASLVLVDGTRRDVDGGWYLPDTSMQAEGQELKSLRAQKAVWDTQPATSETPPTSIVLIIIAGVVGAVLGAGLVIATKH